MKIGLTNLLIKMKFKHLIFWLSILLMVIIYSCSPEEQPKKKITYNNIIILSDNSTRLLRQPNDSAVIEQIIQFFITDCIKPGIKINDRSSIYFSRLNKYNSKCSAARIDIEEIESLELKQRFVNSAQLDSAIHQFKSAIKCNYLERDRGGIDLISLLYIELEKGTNIKHNKLIITQYDTTEISYENHFFIFSDGYLEFIRKNANTEFYFGQKQIDKIRMYCIENEVMPEEALLKNQDFRLQPIDVGNSRLVNLYILETDDRGFNPKTGTQKNNGTLSDNYILKEVWTDWAKRSNFKRFKWKRITSKDNLPSDYIKRIIESK